MFNISSCKYLSREVLKTLEARGFLMFSGGAERDQWHKKG